MIAALENAMNKLPKDVKVIPGHGAVATLEDVRAFMTMLKETRGVIAKGVQAGKTLQQLQQAKVLPQWEKFQASSSRPICPSRRYSTS